MCRNYNNTRIPGLIGFIDGTNVAIKTPIMHEGLYVNRKGYHAQHVQIVSNRIYIINHCTFLYNICHYCK